MPTKQTYPLNQSPLYKLGSRSKLAKLLRISNSDLRKLSAGEALYAEFDIPKEDVGKFRRVENPKRQLKLLQARIARMLSAINPPDFLFCPVKGRCYVTNAAAHKDSRIVQCLDIKNFFPSTPQRRVFYFFHKIMKCEKDIAGLLAKLACYKGHLPTGSPLSPILAYFSYYDLWEKIASYCRERSFIFTVYIDDITISGERVPKRAIWDVQKMIAGIGLEYHKEKTFVDRPAEVTGVVLKDGCLVAPFRQHKKMHEAQKAIAHATDEEREAVMGRIAGIVGQIRQIASKN